jgi:hypothetical protein
VLTLTSDGPIGKFKCKMRSLMTLNLLHQRLLRELYEAVFAGKPAPTRHHEAMTTTDTLDFVDFTEVGCAFVDCDWTHCGPHIAS